MDFEEYRKRGKEMVDYIADYLENIRDRRVYPDVKPGFLRSAIPDSAPVDGEPWDNIMRDVERVIMPGVTHWQSPHMHAYFPALNSFPSLLGDMLADAINCLGFTWASSPVCTELETIVMNWLGKMIGLPDDFLHIRSDSPGGGVIQTTASEATFVCLLAGRTEAIRRYKKVYPEMEDAEINSRLVAYCSDQAHSSVEKAGLIGLVKMRYIESDDQQSLRGDKLIEALNRDKDKGLIPFFLCATLGTTGTCAFDKLHELGPLCKSENLWLHVDAAYAGTAFICPEFRTWMSGMEFADSFAFNPSKWMMVHFDCTAMWYELHPVNITLHVTLRIHAIAERKKKKNCLNRSITHGVLIGQDFIDESENLLTQGRKLVVGSVNLLDRLKAAVPYIGPSTWIHFICTTKIQHWQIPLSKRFRALKLWFVIRNYGIKGLQKHVRESVRLAQKFEVLVLADSRFEVPCTRHLGMVVFRLKGDNDLTEKLLKRLNARGNLHCVPAAFKGKYVIRFTVTSQRTTVEDITKDWAEIKLTATDILQSENVVIAAPRPRVRLAETRERNEHFGSSLLLANSPMSPKIVNGSFAAIFDEDEFLSKCTRTFGQLQLSYKDSPAMRRRVKGILMSGKQFSLDSRIDLVSSAIQTSAERRPLSENVQDGLDLMPESVEENDEKMINETVDEENELKSKIPLSIDDMDTMQ